MATVIQTLTSIDERTAAMAADMAEIKNEITYLRKDVDELKLARARLDGQIELMWKLGAFLGLSGIVAMIKAFAG